MFPAILNSHTHSYPIGKFWRKTKYGSLVFLSLSF